MKGVHTLGIRGSLHTASGLAEGVSEVDVPLGHDGLVEGRELPDHLQHGLLQQVLLLALLHVFFTDNPNSKQTRGKTKLPPRCFAEMMAVGLMF